MSEATAFALGDAVMFRSRPMYVAGRMQLEGASGQLSYRYLLSGAASAPVLLEQAAADRYALLRPFPPAAQPLIAANTMTVGEERYTLVGVRRLTVLESLGQLPGAATRTEVLLSGMYEGPMGTLMREFAPGSELQVYYLVKPLGADEMCSAAAHSAARVAQSRAAGAAADLEDD